MSAFGQLRSYSHAERASAKVGLAAARYPNGVLTQTIEGGSAVVGYARAGASSEKALFVQASMSWASSRWRRANQRNHPATRPLADGSDIF